jgi:Skp family chaperone for outer membrane proteins
MFNHNIRYTIRLLLSLACLAVAHTASEKPNIGYVNSDIGAHPMA